MSGEGPTYTMAKDVLRRASKFQYLMDSEHCSICDQNILYCEFFSSGWWTGEGECEGC